MSMLAERKRKQKFNLNPRGKLWSEDSNKFGQKMLEKMGWTSGKGLGAKEDGMTEHVKQTYKNDVSGIGYKDNGDQWTKHEVEFTSLLQNLTGDSPTELVPQESLEKKSQSSRKRVHYHKFTRGKDLSAKSEKDIAQIFGKKSLKDISKVEEVKEEENDDKNFGVVTVHGGSITDYFKSKMNGFVSKTKDSDDERPSFKQDDSEERPSFSMNGGNNQIDRESDDERPCFGKSENPKDISSLGMSSLQLETPKEDKALKKKKKKTKVVITECFDNAGFVDFSKEEINNGFVEETPSKKRKLDTITEEEDKVDDDGGKKKKKSKKMNEFEEIKEESDEGKKKKKKSKKSLESEEINNEMVNEEEPKIDDSSEKKKKKKSKNKEEIKTDETINEEQINGDELEEKPKKKKSKKVEGIENPNFNDTVESLEISQTEEKKKKKSKKNKVEGIDNPGCTEINDSITSESTENTKKKKKGIENPACISTEIIDTIEPQESVNNSNEVIRKKSKKRKSNGEILDNGLDNPACIANTIEQKIQETIASVSDAVDEYQLELENKINEGKEHEKKAQDIWNSLQPKIEEPQNGEIKENNNLNRPKQKNNFNRRSYVDKKSVKNVIQGQPRLNFRGANLFKLAGYGLDR